MQDANSNHNYFSTLITIVFIEDNTQTYSSSKFCNHKINYD